MILFTRMKLRLLSFLRRGEMETGLANELDFHLAEQEKEYRLSGMTEDDAKAAARKLFGSVPALEEQCRDHRQTRWLDDLLGDTRFAWRSFGKAPVFTAMAVLTLALGIGANAAFFSVAYAILFRPLPYPCPDRLVDMEDGIAGVGPVTTLRALSRTTDYAGYYADNVLNLQISGEAWRVHAAAVTWNLDRVLGVSPLLGRWFIAKEEIPSQSHKVIISHRIWQDRFSSDSNILGRRILLNEEPFEIVGVMPANFAFPATDTEMWVPIRLDRSNVGYFWGSGNLWPIGRLRDGMSIPAAQSELTPAIDRIRPMFPWRMPDAWSVGATVAKHSDSLVKDARPKFLALSMASFLLLLIACGNVANLLLARAVKREREFAMREALGARRGRLIRQLITENVLLAFGGGVAGLLAAVAIINVLPSLLPKDTPRLSEIAIDPALTIAAGLAMLLVTILFSIMPIARLLRTESEPLVGRATTASRRTSAISLSLIGVELALATALLIGAGLMVRTLWQLSSVDSGIRANRVVVFKVSAGPSRCGNPDQCLSLLGSIEKTLQQLPGVQRVSWANAAPLDDDLSAMAVDIQDHPKPVGAPAWVLWNGSITPGYFGSLGVPLLSGRLFTDSDRSASSPVLIVSESTAKRFWPHESAIGKRIRAMSELNWRTVVGVVEDVKQYSLTGFPNWVDGVQYLPLAQTLPHVAQNIELSMFVELSRPISSAALTKAVRPRFPDVVMSNAQTIGGIRSDSIADRRSTARLLALFAGVGLLLGIAGVYGVISHRAAQRTREIGIRMALGASAARVIRMVLSETLLISLIGTAAGVALAFGLSRFLRSLLFGVTTHDTVTLLICPAALISAALLAASIPGFRASRIDPALTLRDE